jgi:hypothetical protein
MAAAAQANADTTVDKLKSLFSQSVDQVSVGQVSFDQKASPFWQNFVLFFKLFTFHIGLFSLDWSWQEKVSFYKYFF